MSITGSISLKHGPLLGTLHFRDHGWLAADIAQYLGEILTAEDREIAILKLLGYTMEIRKEWPPRKSTHWVEIDLDNRVLTTNSELIRKAVNQIAEDPKSWVQIVRQSLQAHSEYVCTFQTISEILTEK